MVAVRFQNKNLPVSQSKHRYHYSIELLAPPQSNEFKTLLYMYVDSCTWEEEEEEEEVGR
jgi:hypothetical protein